MGWIGMNWVELVWIGVYWDAQGVNLGEYSSTRINFGEWGWIGLNWIELVESVESVQNAVMTLFVASPT